MSDFYEEEFIDYYIGDEEEHDTTSGKYYALEAHDKALGVAEDLFKRGEYSVEDYPLDVKIFHQNEWVPFSLHCEMQPHFSAYKDEGEA